MTWLKVAADKPQGLKAFTAWLSQEAAKFPALRRIISDPVQPEKFSDRLRELESFRPSFITFEKDVHDVQTPEGPKQYARLGAISVDEDFLYQKAKEYGLSSTEASRRIGQFLGFLEHSLSISPPPKPGQRVRELRPADVPRGLEYMVPQGPSVTEEQIERGGTPTKATPLAPVRTPEEQRAGETVGRLGERLRQLIERSPTPAVKEEAPSTQEVPGEIEDIPRRRRRDPLDALSEEERQEADEIMREMVQQGLIAAPEKAPKTRGDLTEWWKELLEVGGAVASPAVAPAASDAVNQEVSHLVEELVQQVRDPKKVAVKIKVSR